MPAVFLTSHLYSLSTVRPYSAATQHPFLTAAGNGTLSSEHLSCYLAQDRIYAAHAYPRFIGSTLVSIPFSSLHSLDSADEKFNQRVVKMTYYALANVVREAEFFVDTAKRYDLNLEVWKERKQTRDYAAEMAKIGAAGRLEDCLVFLWAMERVYLDAWKYVASVYSSSENDKEGSTNSALAALIENWTNREFEKFVDDLADIVNSLNIKPDSEAWTRAEQIWSRVIELEEAFWPVGGEELTLLSKNPPQL